MLLKLFKSFIILLLVILVVFTVLAKFLIFKSVKIPITEKTKEKTRKLIEVA